MADNALQARDNGIAAAVKSQRPQEVIKPAEPIKIRRFERPDLDQHGAWLLERLRTVYPGVTEMILYSRLMNILYNNEFLVLYQDDAVAVAQLVRGNSLNPRPSVHEWFVFVKNPADKAAIDRASAFYADFVRWGYAQDCEAIVLSSGMSDVPIEEARKHLGGRIHEKQQLFVPLKKG